MASKIEYDIDEGYQQTQTYLGSSPERRRQLNRYKRECNISDEHMYLMLFQQDLLLLPEDVRKKGDTSTLALVVVGFLLLWSSLQSAMGAQGGVNVPLIFMAVASFVLVAIIYYTGMLNPYKRTVREVEKRLKKMPDVPDFYEWEKKNPAKPISSNKSNRGKKRKKRR